VGIAVPDCRVCVACRARDVLARKLLSVTSMRHTLTFPTLLLVGLLAGCSAAGKSPDVTDGIRASLDQNGLKTVSVSQDRDKGVVTLSGQVAADADKAQAESLAKSIAGSQVVANEIIVTPPGIESDAKKINSALDDAVSSDLKAYFIQYGLSDSVSYSVHGGVVTLTGRVDTEAKRAHAEKLASSVKNVTQVVNEIQVKDQKATSQGAGSR
jgi:hyperosmotically inducible protein